MIFINLKSLDIEQFENFGKGGGQQIEKQNVDGSKTIGFNDGFECKRKNNMVESWIILDDLEI